MLVDASAREQIRTSLDETLAVEAAAGTGKTTVLVDRIVNVLAAGRTTVDRLVAVTFTEKAAGELKLRLRTELDARRATADASTREPLDAALERLEQAHVSTIHTFCADLLRERPVEAGVDPQFTMLTEPQAERLFGQVFRDWLQQRLEAPPAGVRRALRRSGFDDDGGPTGRLQRAAWTLAEWRDFEGAWRRDPAFDRASRIQALADELASFDATTREPGDREDALFVSTAAARRLHTELTFAEQVRPRDHDGLEARLVDLCSWSFRNARIGRKTAPYRKGVPRTEVIAAHQRLVALLEAFKRDADADLAALLRDELIEVIGHYQEAKARLGALDFLDLLASARDLVRDHDGVRAAFQARFTRICSSTSSRTPIRCRRRSCCCSPPRDPATRIWREVAPLPGKLFIVGDPKQSIYRFRRADVGIYEEVREQLRRHGAACLELTTSFRCVPTIQRAVNAAFAPRMTGNAGHAAGQLCAAVAGAVADIPGQPALVALPVPRPFGWREQVTKRAVDRVAAGCGGRLRRLAGDAQRLARDRSRVQPTSPARSQRVTSACCSAASIRASSAARQPDRGRDARLRAGARGAGHPASPGRRQVVPRPRRDRDDAHRARGDRVARRRAVGVRRRCTRGVLCGRRRSAATNTGVGRSCPPVPDRPPTRRSPATDARCRSGTRSTSARAAPRRNHRPVADTIGRLLRDPRAHAGFALRPAGEQALANVLHVAELARQYEAGGGLSFRGFVDQLREEAESARAAEAPILEEGSDGVRMMTAHSAKGLEFPVVMLADITAELSRATASRYVDSSTGRFAVSLGGLGARRPARPRRRPKWPAMRPRGFASPMWPPRAHAICWSSPLSAISHSIPAGYRR